MSPALRTVALILATITALWSAGIEPQTAAAADAMLPLDLRQVKVGGEIGRRVDVTVNNNLLMLDVEKTFLAPFRARKDSDGFVGLQEFFIEKHLRTVSDRFDFDAVRVGIQPFTTDFRGFLFRPFPASRAIQTSVRTLGGPSRLSGRLAPKKV